MSPSKVRIGTKSSSEISLQTMKDVLTEGTEDDGELADNAIRTSKLTVSMGSASLSRKVSNLLGIGKEHQFKETEFAIMMTCDICNLTIWGK